jgi:hypothetical protein
MTKYSHVLFDTSQMIRSHVFDVVVMLAMSAPCAAKVVCRTFKTSQSVTGVCEINGAFEKKLVAQDENPTPQNKVGKPSKHGCKQKAPFILHAEPSPDCASTLFWGKGG